MHTRVAKLRNARNWTQEQLADVAGVSRSQVTRLEAGNLNATLNTLGKIARALDVTIPDLFSSADDPALDDVRQNWRGLTAAHRRVVLELIRTLRSEQQEEAQSGDQR